MALNTGRMKIICIAQLVFSKCLFNVAHRLVGGLASEKVRWAESVQKFKEEEKTLAGDVLLTASYLSYVGCFGRSYRIDLLEQQWLKFLQTQEVLTITLFQLCTSEYVMLLEHTL